jgi:formylglycine-generating enzyme
VVRRFFQAGLAALALAAFFAASGRAVRADQPPAPPGCPSDMVRVRTYCVDRFEASLVDATSRAPLSPYYSPQPRLLSFAYAYWAFARRELGEREARSLPLPEISALQRTGKQKPLAVSRAGVVPQAYLSYFSAHKACQTAGKRLCTKEEWISACRGEHDTRYPYGPAYQKGQCNVFRSVHPAHVLHGNASLGHLDPRLNLLVESGKDPLLRLTGATPACASVWGADRIFDMVGNLDEWIEDETGVFLGSFYARSTNKGCDAEITGHSAGYHDYSTGTRCCRDVG